jgi:hypothetical protein
LRVGIAQYPQLFQYERPVLAVWMKHTAPAGAEEITIEDGDFIGHNA